MERDAHPADSSASSIPPPRQPLRGALLAIATSGAWISVAVLRQAGNSHDCESVAEPAGADQASHLLAMIGGLLGADGLAAVDAIAFDAGPGAFTGLRIGCSVAQGLGFASGVPLVPVGSLEAAAWRAVRQAGVAQAVVPVVNDARMGGLYAAVCAVSVKAGGALSIDILIPARLERPDGPSADLSREAIDRANPESAGWRWLLAGDAWHGVALGDGWRELARNAGATAPVAAVAADAHSVAELGLALWRAGRAVAAHEAAPRYVRDKVALDVDEQRALRERRDAGIESQRRRPAPEAGP